MGGELLLTSLGLGQLSRSLLPLPFPLKGLLSKCDGLHEPEVQGLLARSASIPLHSECSQQQQSKLWIVLLCIVSCRAFFKVKLNFSVTFDRWECLPDCMSHDANAILCTPCHTVSLGPASLCEALPISSRGSILTT